MPSHNDFTAKLEKLRAQIAAAQNALVQAGEAPVPLALALARADELVEGLADNYSPPVTPFSEREYRAPSLVDPESFDLARAVASFVAWSVPNELRKKLRAEIQARYDGLPEGIDDKARAKRKAELREALFELECDEERLIVSAASEGQRFERRADVNPEAMLAV